MNLTKMRQHLARIEHQKKNLEYRISMRSERELRQLPDAAGVRNVDDLLEALSPLASMRLRAQLTGVRPDRSVARRRGRQPRFNEEIRADVRAMLEAGELTAAEIASRAKVFAGTVNLWKKQWGLTKPRA